jgi:potassium-dependent mechanosensitive channel
MRSRHSRHSRSNKGWKLLAPHNAAPGSFDYRAGKNCPTPIVPPRLVERLRRIHQRLTLARARNHWLWSGALAAAFIVLGVPVYGQQTPQTPPGSSEKAVAAIPLADVASEAESVTTVVRDIVADLSTNESTEAVAQDLPATAREIDDRLRETRKIVGQNPTIEILRNLEAEWDRWRREVAGLNKNLTGRVNDLERDATRLEQLGKTWNQTFAVAKDSNAPPEVLGRIKFVINEIGQAREAVEKQRARALAIQNRLGVQDSRIADALRLVGQARENTLNRLFLRDGAPIWRLEIGSRGAQHFQEESLGSFSTQWTALSHYAGRQAMRFVLPVVIFALLAAALYWTRRRMDGLSTEKSGRATPVFERPIATALILALLGSQWIYPDAPRLFWTVLGAFALIPSVIILRRIITSDLYPILYALVAFFFLDQVRILAAAVEFLPRLLFLVEMLGAMFFSLWLVRSFAWRGTSSSNGTRAGKSITFGAWVVLVNSSVVFVANLLGYVTLANLLGNALLESSYLALILYAIVEVVDGLIMIALNARPFAALRVVGRHRLLLRQRVRRILQVLAVAVWVTALLQQLLLREQVFSAAREFLISEFSVGSIQISPGELLAFAVTVWAAFLLSRFVRFLLDEDVYPRVHLQRGLAYAISNTLHYLILLVGFLLAAAALGLDMTRMTILAGAFSIGVGFGLQNIFNNFVSGLILLFERPISIGDVVQIDDAVGVVERIGIRASIIRTTSGSEIIMPNGKLISERVINWTLSSRQHGIELPVAVAQGNDPGRVIELLERTAAAHSMIVRDPPPQALVVKLGADALGFELRAWTDHSEQWMQIRSELALAISAALAAENIAIR